MKKMIFVLFIILSFSCYSQQSKKLLLYGMQSLYKTSSTITTVSSATTININYPSGIQSGDILVSVIAADQNVAWSAETGWQAMGTGRTTGISVVWFYRTASGSESGTKSFTHTGTANIAGLMYLFKSSTGYSTGKTPVIGTATSYSHTRSIASDEWDINAVVLLSNQTISITGNVGIKNIDTQTATNWAFSLYETDKTESSQTNTFSWTNSSLYGICKPLLIK